jgi:transposase InsO family protein
MKFNRVAAALAPTTSQKKFAQATEVVPRTIRNWRKRRCLEDFPKLGRPAHDERAHRAAFWRVGREWLRQGRPGWRPVRETLGPDVPTSLIQHWLRVFKERDRQHERERLRRRRESVSVLAKDAFWVQDAAQVGRDNVGEKVDAQAIKDRGTLLTVGIATGGPAEARQTIELLENLRTRRGLPLVLGTDNGSPFVAEPVRNYLRNEKVIHLLSLPRTPQHNSAAEIGIGELKRCARLASDLQIDPAAAHAALVRAATLINNNRPRASKGLKTGAELDETFRVGYTVVSREQFYSECSEQMAEARKSAVGPRAMRMAERAAVFATLEKYGLVKWTRGGSQATLKEEIFL